MTDLNTSIKVAVGQLVANLNDRNRDIISRRFGLKTGKKETLESIGQHYDITRERVRQIEEASLASMRANLEGDSKGTITSFVELAGGILEARGGTVREDVLFKEFSGTGKESNINASLAFILTLDGRYERTPEDDDYRTFWSISPVHTKAFKESIESLVSALDSNKTVIPQAAVADFAKNKSLKSLTPKTLESYISISKAIDCNVFGELGLSRWADIKPRGVRDKSYLILKKEGKPKHFREIAQLINQAHFSDRKAHVQTVHNELIKDERFVLVGRGTYALAQWGYQPGTVKQVIADLLRSKGPLAKDKIVAEVMTARFVKQNTILLGMQDKSLFRETSDGRISLKEV